VIPA